MDSEVEDIDALFQKWLDGRTDKNKIVLRTGKEKYVFLFDTVSIKQTRLKLGDFARNADLKSFKWVSAAVMNKRIDAIIEEITAVRNHFNQVRFSFPFSDDDY